MPEQDSIKEKLKDDLPGNAGKSAYILNKPFTLGLIAFIVLAALFSVLIYQRYLIVKQTQKKEAYDMASVAKNKLQEALSYSSSATRILSFFIDNDGTILNFDSVASEILTTNKDIDVLELVPDGVIRYVYPLKGNEAVVGYNILKDPLRNKEAFKAIEKRELFFSGPFELKQGGFGIVGRLPVFRKGKFWGFSAVVIKMSTLLNAAGIDSTNKSGYYFQLSKINPDTKKDEFFIRHDQEPSRDYSIYVNVPNGDWKLSVEPAGGYKGLSNIWILASIAILFSIVGGIFVFIVVGRPAELDKLVKERTRQLKESEENYKILFEKSPLPLWIYDLETFRFLEVNDAAINLYGYSREEFLKMDLLAIRPKDDIDKFIKSARGGTDELRESGVWTHIKKNREEIQLLIFSRNIFYKGKKGRLVLLMDVSEKVKVENELIKSEEKYRSLIEQASDGIILYSFDGTIHSFNKAAYTQTGYTREEFEKLNLKNLFLEEETRRNGSKDKKINTDNPTTLYRKLKRKDGSVFVVELNARMLPDGKIFAIVRDITEREKTEAALKASEEKFSKAFHSNLLGLALYDAEFRIVDTNEVYAAILESGRDELMGKNSEEAGMISKVKNEKRAIINQKIDDIFNREGRLNNFEMEIETSNGEIRSVLVSMEPMQLNNSQYSLTSAIDISEKKKAEQDRAREERTRQLIMNSTLDAIICINAEGNITLWNPQAEKIFGWTEEEIKGRRLSETIIPPQYRERHENGMKRYLETGEGRMLNKLLGITALNREGKEFPIELSIIPLEQDGQQSFCAFVRDITERKISEEELNRSNERFELIAEATNDAIWDHDLTKNETWGNKKLYSIYGFEDGNSKIDLEMFLSRIHPDERKGIEERMQKAMDQKLTSISEEFRFKTGDGTYRSFYDRAYIKYDEELKPARFLGAMHDITDRESIKQQIIKEKGLSDSIINSLPGVFYLYNKEGKFLRWNKNFERVTGYTGEEISRMHPLDFFDKEDQPLLAAKIANVFATGEDDVEANFLLKNKQKIPYYFTGQAIEYEGQSCLMGVGLDFSEKEKAKRAILESEAKYRELIEQASDGIFISNLDGKYIDVNTNACRMLGYSKEELLNMSGADILFYPQDVNALPKRYEELRTGRSYIVETILRRKDGSSLAVESNSKMLPDGRFIGIVRDIRERKKAEEELYLSEQKYRLLFYNNPLPMWMTTIPDLDIIDVNESAIRQYGYTREEFLKLNSRDLRPAEDVENFMKEVDKWGPGINNVRAWRHKKKDGTIIHVETYSHEILYEGKPVWLALSHDVTEKYKAKELLQKSYEDIRQLASNLQSIREDERTNIAREIHDELGQQLTGLKMDMHWLTRKIKSADEEVNQKMKESIQLINATITSVRKIATDLRPSILDDLGLLAALEWQSDEFEKRSGTKVKFVNTAGDINVLPKVATALFRIYQELLTNIARHANAELVTASLYTGDERLYFSIADNGSGFNIETINKKKTLGLLGIKERTLLMGGTYEIRTKPGEGSEIIISIPLDLAKTMA